MSSQRSAVRSARASAAIGAGAVGAAALLFGTSGVATQLLAPGIVATSAAGWRVVIGGSVLVAICAALGRAPWSYPARWWVIASGSLAFLGFQVGYFLAVGRVGVAAATILAIGTGPVVAGLLDRVRHGAALPVRWWIGVAVAITGIAVMTGAGNVVFEVVAGAAAIGAGCCFPFFGDAIRDLTADRPAITAVATVFGAAVLPAVVLLLLVGTDPLATPGTAATLLYLGLVTTAAAYVLWSAGLAVLSLSDTVTLTMIEPIAAAVLAVAILGEPAGPATVVGVLATLTGVWIATTRTRSVARSGSAGQLRRPRRVRAGPRTGDRRDPGGKRQGRREALERQGLQASAQVAALRQVVQQPAVEGIAGPDGVHQRRRRDRHPNVLPAQ
jgi:DME family drug/metabolite transporter